jgi:hypothetical protein
MAHQSESNDIESVKITSKNKAGEITGLEVKYFGLDEICTITDTELATQILFWWIAKCNEVKSFLPIR